MNGKWKCTVANNHVKPCDGLFKSTSSIAPRDKLGVQRVPYMNIETGKPSRTFYTIRSGDYSKTGVVVNYCPFCGVNISEMCQ